MSQLNRTVSLALGTSRKLTNIAQVTGTGTLLFTVPPRPDGGEFSALFQAVGTLTSFSADLQADASGGNGTNLTNYKTAFITASTPLAVLPASGTTPLVAGATYALNVTAGSGPLDVYATLN